MVQEYDGRWSLPGGWVDVNAGVMENTTRELKKGAGIIKVFIECEYLSGKFETNIKTINNEYFTLNNLPELATEKVTRKQIEMCFKAQVDKNWQCLCE